MNSIFIPFPWSENVTNEIYISEDQISAVYDIIIKAFNYKYLYETNKNIPEAENYNLNNIRVYNSFINQNIETVYDPVARDYVLNTLKVIAKNDFKKKSVRESYEELYTLFSLQKAKQNSIKYFLCRNNNQFIDFASLFQCANIRSLSKVNGPLAEVYNFYKQRIADYRDNLLN